MKPTKRAATHAEDIESKPGAFMPDGSWNENSELRHRGHAHRFVVALCRERRALSLTPNLAANAVVAANMMIAFPNFADWSTIHERAEPGATLWPLVYCTTAAEEAVKRAGRGIAGHWCGEEWKSGPETACGEPRHHEYPSHEEVRVMLTRIHAKLPALGPKTTRRDPPESSTTSPLSGQP